MGTPQDEELSDFQKSKRRIDHALEFLRGQLKELRDQDVTLLRHMMQIHCTINALSGKQGILKRSYSSGYNLHNSAPDVGLLNATSTPSLPQKHHSHLSRHQSEPIRNDAQNDPTDGDTEDDPLSWSYTSLGDLSYGLDGSLSDSLPAALPSCLRGPLEAITEVRSEGVPSSNTETSSGDDMDYWMPTVEFGEEHSVGGSVFSSSTEEEPGTYRSELICVPSREILVHSGVIVNKDTTSSVSSEISDTTETDGLCDLATKPEYAPQEIEISLPQPSVEGRQRYPLRRTSRLEQYEVPYEDMLRRSSKLWREIQQEHTDTGKVDARKMIALKLFL